MCNLNVHLCLLSAPVWAGTVKRNSALDKKETNSLVNQPRSKSYTTAV